MNQELEIKERPKGSSLLKDQIELFRNAPQLPEVIPGILPNTFGFVYGPPKAGKSILVENIFYAFCAKKASILQYPISGIENNKCLFVSLEERPFRRNARNVDQLKAFSEEEQEMIKNNFIVSTSELPPYIMNDRDWDALYDLIAFDKPGFVCIDSLSRLTPRSIGDEEVAKENCARLRKISDEMNTTLFIVNHVYKRGNEDGLGIFSMSGSRIYSQEADFMLGVNKLPNQMRYVKQVANRYTGEESETVDCFKINDHKVVEFVEQKSESQLIRQGDKRFDKTNLEKVRTAILKCVSEKNTDSFKTEDINFLHTSSPKEMGRDTFHRMLNLLEEDGVIQACKRGEYRLINKN
jgi:predicted ATP-dependent serine protease